MNQAGNREKGGLWEEGDIGYGFEDRGEVLKDEIDSSRPIQCTLPLGSLP